MSAAARPFNFNEAFNEVMTGKNMVIGALVFTTALALTSGDRKIADFISSHSRTSDTTTVVTAKPAKINVEIKTPTASPAASAPVAAVTSSATAQVPHAPAWSTNGGSQMTPPPAVATKPYPDFSKLLGGVKSAAAAMTSGTVTTTPAAAKPAATVAAVATPAASAATVTTVLPSQEKLAATGVAGEFRFACNDVAPKNSFRVGQDKGGHKIIISPYEFIRGMQEDKITRLFDAAALEGVNCYIPANNNLYPNGHQDFAVGAILWSASADAATNAYAGQRPRVWQVIHNELANPVKGDKLTVISNNTNSGDWKDGINYCVYTKTGPKENPCFVETIPALEEIPVIRP